MSIESMKNRLKYYGGGNQVDRMNRDKLKSLKDALTKSYQAAIARFSDGREFRCLINPDKLTFNEYIKIISFSQDQQINLLCKKDLFLFQTGNIKIYYKVY